MSEADKMSEEEIIKNLNDLLEHNYLEDVGYLREENDYVVYNNAIQGLLDLYQQEKEKNKELTDFIEAIEELKQAKKPITDLVYEMNKFKDDYISKDKIRAKIKELEGQEDWYIENKSLDDLYGRIDELKELLKEK